MSSNIVASYHTTTDKAERMRLQGEAIRAMRPDLERLSARLVPEKYRDEGTQVAAIGLLVALERFRPARGRTFRSVALGYAQVEIKTWLDAGSYWRPKQDDADVHAKLRAFFEMLTPAERRCMFLAGRKSRAFNTLVKRAAEFMRKSAAS